MRPIVAVLLAAQPAVLARRALVVIDMTVGQWEGISYRKNATLQTITRLMANRTEPHFDVIVDTHLALDCAQPEHATICEIDWPRGQHATSLLPSLVFPHSTYVSKQSYSSFSGSALETTLRAAGVDEVYLTGINTDYCVFATALSGWERAFEVRVVLDGVTSCNGAAGHAEGLRMLQRFFGEQPEGPSFTKRVALVHSADIPPLATPPVAPRAATEATSAGGPREAPAPEAWTLNGAPLYAPTFSGLPLLGFDAQISIARHNLQLAPRADPAKHVWLGRRLAYKWQFRMALVALAAALARWPEDAPLHRHRGHRYITSRNFSRAEADLHTASRLIEGTADSWEAEGMPNPYNLPLSSLHFNVHYHLGLSRYLQADFAGAIRAYEALPTAGSYANDESLAARAHWEYMALRRAGHAATSAEVNRTLAPIHSGMRALDGGSYYLALCLLYKGAGPLPDLSNASALEVATLGYGVGNWHLYNGRKAEAIAMWRRVVGTSYWAAFGFIAAEAELHRLGVVTRAEGAGVHRADDDAGGSAQLRDREA